jgi:hypothetical protein
MKNLTLVQKNMIGIGAAVVAMSLFFAGGFVLLNRDGGVAAIAPLAVADVEPPEITTAVVHEVAVVGDEEQEIPTVEEEPTEIAEIPVTSAPVVATAPPVTAAVTTTAKPKTQRENVTASPPRTRAPRTTTAATASEETPPELKPIIVINDSAIYRIEIDENEGVIRYYTKIDNLNSVGLTLRVTGGSDNVIYDASQNGIRFGGAAYFASAYNGENGMLASGFSVENGVVIGAGTLFMFQEFDGPASGLRFELKSASSVDVNMKYWRD